MYVSLYVYEIFQIFYLIYVVKSVDTEKPDLKLLVNDVCNSKF